MRALYTVLAAAGWTRVLSALIGRQFERIHSATTSPHRVTFDRQLSVVDGEHAPYIWVSSAYKWGDRPCSSRTAAKSNVYIMNSGMAQSTSSAALRRPNDRSKISWRLRRTYWVLISRFDRNRGRATSSIPKLDCKCGNCSRILWLTVSKAAGRSSGTRGAKSPRSTNCKISARWRSVSNDLVEN